MQSEKLAVAPPLRHGCDRLETNGARLAEGAVLAQSGSGNLAQP
jgi:hypothetical protein